MDADVELRGLILVAASGLAKEVLAAERAAERFSKFVVVDDNEDLWGSAFDGAQVVGGLDSVAAHPSFGVCICAGAGRSRRAIATRLEEAGLDPRRYVQVIHPRVVVPDGCEVGRGSVILEGVVMTADITVGDHVVVMPHVTLTHDDVVSDYATLCAGVSLGGGVVVGEAVYVGMNASVRERVTLGAGSTLGMGAALVRDLPPGETWVGVPARSRGVHR